MKNTKASLMLVLQQLGLCVLQREEGKLAREESEKTVEAFKLLVLDQNQQCCENTGLPVYFIEQIPFWLWQCWLQGATTKKKQRQRWGETSHVSWRSDWRRERVKPQWSVISWVMCNHSV